ncbi:MAG: serine hydrolase [Parcubacteria group bacterium]
MIKKYLKLATAGAIILVGGIFLGFLYTKFYPSQATILRLSSENTPSDSVLSFLNQDVVLKLNKHYIINFLPLKQKLLAIQKQYPQRTYIYFDYLNNASWIGLNERELFTAASTVKVPLAMSLLKAVENELLKVSDSYALNELDLDSNFGKLYKVGKDRQFTVEDLIKIMLEQSDNTAMTAIANIMSNIGITDPLRDVYNYMGWMSDDLQFIPVMGQSQELVYQKIDMKILSNMFLSLYNANYLNPENSQKILSYLANTPFNNKIAAGVPDAVTVAHKIGTSAEDKTFSDCGIIYAPNRNYLLCLGSNGGDEAKASKFMTEVSKTVYDYVINK